MNESFIEGIMAQWNRKNMVMAGEVDKRFSEPVKRINGKSSSSNIQTLYGIVEEILQRKAIKTQEEILMLINLKTISEMARYGINLAEWYNRPCLIEEYT